MLNSNFSHVYCHWSHSVCLRTKIYCDLRRCEHAGSGYFLIDPVLRHGKDREVLPLDCVQCQTVLTKCLGPFDGWKEKLAVSRESGYNFVHFTPIQELGDSLSCYSLRNHRRLNPMFSTPNRTYDMKDMEELVNMMCDEWKVSTCTNYDGMYHDLHERWSGREKRSNKIDGSESLSTYD